MQCYSIQGHSSPSVLMGSFHLSITVDCCWVLLWKISSSRKLVILLLGRGVAAVIVLLFSQRVSSHSWETQRELLPDTFALIEVCFLTSRNHITKEQNCFVYLPT